MDWNTLCFFDCPKRKTRFRRKRKHIGIRLQRSSKVQFPDVEDKPGTQRKIDVFDDAAIWISNEEFKHRKKSEVLRKQKLKYNIKQIEAAEANVLCSSDEEEDTQGFLFEETKLSAPGFLSQLEKIIETLSLQKRDDETREKQLLEEIKTLCGDVWWGRRQDGIQAELSLNVIEIPVYLTSLLLASYADLAKGAAYCKRKWQTNIYKEYEEQEGKDSFLDKMSSMHCGVTDNCDDAIVKTVKDHHVTPVVSSSIIDRRTSKDHSARSSQVSIVDGRGTPSIIACRKDSKVPAHKCPKPRTRAERFQSYIDRVKGLDPERSSSGSSKGQARLESLVVSRLQNCKEKSNEGRLSTPNPHHTINFCISSATHQQRGWITSPGNGDLEHLTLIEWARTRLQVVIKKREEQEAIALQRKESGPLILHHYGDAKKDQLAKNRRDAVDKLLASFEDGLPHLFYSCLPDRTKICNYPCGKVAVCSIRSHFKGNGNYHIIYDNKDPFVMLGCFTPLGKGCVNFNSNHSRFLSTDQGGSLYDEHGNVTKKWRWVDGKLQPAIVLQLNKFLTIRCTSQSNILLYVNIEGEIMKFQLGRVPGEKSVTDGDLGFMKTSGNYESKVATQAGRLKRLSIKDDRKTRLAKRVLGSFKADGPRLISEERILELAEKFPERQAVDFSLPHVKHLHHLQRKIKSIAAEWMELYRVVTGIKAPVKVVKRRLDLHSAASLPGLMPSDRNTRSRCSTRRAPSAPPLALNSAQRDRNHSPDYGRPHTSAEFFHPEDGHGIMQLHNRLQTSSLSSYHHKAERSSNKKQTPFRCGIPQCSIKTAWTPKDGCPIALRQQLLGRVESFCRCDKRKIPQISDLEFDTFVKTIPKDQLLVISITSNENCNDDCGEMLDGIYYQMNKCKTYPCIQSKYDPYRILRYIVPSFDQHESLLARRHNVVSGMFLMYTAGRLVFADFIFNGYGNAKQDFLKQIAKTKRDASEAKYLPMDFKFNQPKLGSQIWLAWDGKGSTGPLVAGPNENESRQDWTPHALTLLSGSPNDAMWSMSLTSHEKVATSNAIYT